MDKQVQKQEAVEASEEVAEEVVEEATADEAAEEAIAASEETTAAEEQDEEAATEEAATEEEVEDEADEAEETDATSEQEDTVPMSELQAAQERIAALERREAEREARSCFEALEFSETVAGDKGRAVRRSSKLAPAALETLTELYLALPDADTREKLVAFAEGENTRVPLGEWGPQDAVAFSETATGGIGRALDKMRDALPDDTIDGAIAFAEAEGLTDAKDAEKAVQGYIAKRDNL